MPNYIKNVTRIELPNGTCMTLEGRTAKEIADVITEEMGGKAVQTTNEKKKRSGPSALVTNVPPDVLSLLGANRVMGNEARDGYVLNEEPLELPRFMAAEKPVLHPANGLVYAGQP